MKKIWIGMMILLLCVACQSSSSNEQFQDYYQIKEQLITQQDFDEDYPFCVRVVFNHIDHLYRYDVIIDQPEVDMYYIEAMAYASEDNQKMCPVLGIVDDSISHMKVDISKCPGFAVFIILLPDAVGIYFLDGDSILGSFGNFPSSRLCFLFFFCFKFKQAA